MDVLNLGVWVKNFGPIYAQTPTIEKPAIGLIMVSNRCSAVTVCLLEGLTLIGLILKLSQNFLQKKCKPLEYECI